MSSHHIVRDDQEPALIIANGAACSQELMGQLLEWSPLVVVLDSAIERVIELGIKVDVLIGDFDRDFNADVYREKQYPIEIVHIADQDSTDLEKACDYLIKRGIPAANIIWATGKRADHTITNITNLSKYKDTLKITMYDDYSRIYPLPKNFKKWYEKDTIISLIPIGEVTNITTTNLMYTLTNESLILGERTGSSNAVVEDGLVTVTYDKGTLLMMECHD
ncbi:thiamine diphosphokinase [Myroides marinus]|uniref:Thiamine diphosphokinase n=1 Tax=Myroides marinus TaxID=703342 RepID=A0A164ATK0_9FLAO|nr:thiamine diphosphokinase [Myroides marinus]KZE84869.1 thiamine pyrophosphokinase [Myroides marinus]MDM1348800.1 thiamine diphosphokinase [Myroides marinus]MDM1354965.1 thiamine diphosphokinase [Myroides marinus]MDM1361753.1 thiamine diphosphokinase [Myroides marinus]MDM1368076.1 thiamine diphosphokinase [Myroides marinus]